MVARALELQRKCWSQERIAKELGVDRRTVERHLQRLNRRAFERLSGRAAAVKGEQADQLRWIAEQAAEGWERSCRDAETVKTTTGTAPGKDGDPAPFDRTETTVRQQAGDPRFLEQMRSTLAEIRKVLGVEHVVESGTPAVSDPLVQAEEIDASYAGSHQPPGPAAGDEAGPAAGDPGAVP